MSIFSGSLLLFRCVNGRLDSFTFHFSFKDSIKFHYGIPVFLEQSDVIVFLGYYLVRSKN
jgi:hypothetical protein